MKPKKKKNLLNVNDILLYNLLHIFVFVIIQTLCLSVDKRETRRGRVATGNGYFDGL